MDQIVHKTILKALGTHKRKHQVLYEKAHGRIGHARYAKNLDKLKAFHQNQVDCVDLVVEIIMEAAKLKRRKTPRFLTDKEKVEVQQTLLSGTYSIKALAIQYEQSYANISVIKRGLGLGRTYKKRK